MATGLPGEIATPTGAVFLSYASEDAVAAGRIAEALKAAGIEVWFDRDELRGGDAWDRKIRDQILECRLFMPVISEHAIGRDEGYFRREWRLAVDRTLDMDERKAFLVPVVLDATSERVGAVPDSFRKVQWARLPAGETPPAFVARVAQLLRPASAPAAGPTVAAGASAPMTPRGPRSRWLMPALAAGVLVAAGAVGWLLLHGRSTTPTPAPVVDKSIAVLPFADLSSGHDLEYVTDGLADELISRLSQAPDLKVIARTSSFQFKGKTEDAAGIAAKLGVANLLEGSVRTAGETLHVNVQLIRARDGTALWSESFERPARDLAGLQEDIAGQVAARMAATLSEQDAGAGTSNPAALMAYLQGRSLGQIAATEREYSKALGLLERAVQLDPQFADGWAELARIRLGYEVTHPQADRELHRDIVGKVREEAETALRLAPGSARAHLALARLCMFFDWDWERAEREMQAALRLDPANADVLRNAVYLDEMLGRWEAAVTHARSATDRDPLNAENFLRLGDALMTTANGHAGAESAFHEALRLQSVEGVHAFLAFADFKAGDLTSAADELQLEPDPESRLSVGTEIDYAAGRRQAADLSLAKLIAGYSKSNPTDVAEAYAFRGDLEHAFEWWGRAYDAHDSQLSYILRYTTVPQAAAAVRDPRFHVLVKKMKLDRYLPN